MDISTLNYKNSCLFFTLQRSALEVWVFAVHFEPFFQFSKQLTTFIWLSLKFQAQIKGEIQNERINTIRYANSLSFDGTNVQNTYSAFHMNVPGVKPLRK